MDQVWLNIFSVLFVFSMAIVSPGPNFILVVNTSLNKSRQDGTYAAIGVATGSGLFAFAGLLGLILIINSLPYFSLLVKFLGGGYLIYLGLSMMRQVNSPAPHLNNQNGQLRSSGRFSAFLHGLVTNLTNPKAWAFYFSLFTLVVKPDFPLWAKIFLCASMFFISLLWYGVISLVISEKRVQERFLRFQPILNGILGSLLMLLGGRLLLRN